MEKWKKNTGMEIRIIFFLAAAVFISTKAVVGESSSPYTNHTVGGDHGWIFDQAANKSKVNYTTWASNLAFSLGDYLIFKTNGNSTVLQTYDLSTYNSCDIHSERVVEFDGGRKPGGAVASIAVPLVKEGDTFYFSGAFDGKQCDNGMKFQIDVVHGNGLPPELSHPPGPPPSSLTLAPPPSPVVPSSPSDQRETFYRGAAPRLEKVWVLVCVLLLVPVVGIFFPVNN